MGRKRLKRNEEIILTEEERQQIEKQVIEQKRIKALRNEITHKLRFEVLERDKFTCVYCGRSPKTTPGLTLEVDHIIPLWAGGDNSMDNLVTACWECNEGKKDKQIQLQDREYKIKKEPIMKLLEEGDFTQWKEFLALPENEEERQYLYDYNEKINHPFCIKDCVTCINSGKFYYIQCIDKLTSTVMNYDEQYKNAEKIRLNNKEDKILENDLIKDIVVVKNIEEMPNTNDSKFSSNVIPYNKSKYDILKCDFCYAALRCPKYRAGATCAFNFTADQNGSFTFDDPETVLRILAKAQGERVMRGLFFEKIDGGALDKNVTNEILTLMGIVKDLKEITEQPTESAEINIVAKGSGKEGTGILSALFRDVLGGGNKEVKDGKIEVIKNNDIDEAKIVENN